MPKGLGHTLQHWDLIWFSTYFPQNDYILVLAALSQAVGRKSMVMRKISTKPNQVSMLQGVPIRCLDSQTHRVKNRSQQKFKLECYIHPIHIHKLILRLWWHQKQTSFSLFSYCFTKFQTQRKRFWKDYNTTKNMKNIFMKFKERKLIMIYHVHYVKSQAINIHKIFVVMSLKMTSLSYACKINLSLLNSSHQKYVSNYPT